MSLATKRIFTPAFKKAWTTIQQVLEEEGVEAARMCFRDRMLELGHIERVKNLYTIKDKLSAKAVPFKMNEHQQLFLETRSGRDLVLKIRQVGFTTLSCVETLDLALWDENFQGGIMAHKLQAVAKIFKNIVKFSYDYFVEEWGHWYNPTPDQNSANELSFSDDGLGRSLKSSIKVGHDFRSSTVNFLHVSEAAYIEEDRLVGSTNSVPATGIVIFESTANGMGGEFHRLYELGKKLGMQAPYQPYFIPWYRFYPENPNDARWQLPEDVELNEYENSLLAEHGEMITRTHLGWRRWCLEANCKGQIETFEQEYPSNDVDCFLSNESSVFGRTIIKTQMSRVQEPKFKGFLIRDGKRIKFVEDDKGYVILWERPKPDRSYAIGADPSSGVGKDFSAALVKDQRSGRIVGKIHNEHLDPGDFGTELFKLGKYFNTAWVCLEINNHGIVTLNKLKEAFYPNLYSRRVLDERTNKPTRQLGFLTTNSEKIRITEQLKASFKEATLMVQDEATVREMSTFMQYANSTGSSYKREGAPGTHDDLVMALALTEEMHLARPSSDDDNVVDPFDQRQVDPDTGFLI
jgi:hypothetical protein